MTRDWCKFFQEIEENPKRLITGLKIRDYLAMREHVQSCDACYNRVQRVDTSHLDNSIRFSSN
jgi:hypothetical protein